MGQDETDDTEQESTEQGIVTRIKNALGMS